MKKIFLTILAAAVSCGMLATQVKADEIDLAGTVNYNSESEFMSLAPGDILLVGVPESAPHAGAGDRVAIEIDGLGRLENRLSAEGAPA